MSDGVSVTMSPIEESEGKIAGWSLVTRNVTERRKAEEALRISQSSFEAILNNDRLIVFLKDLDGRYVFTNWMFERRFGLSHNQAIGKSDDDLFPPEQAAAFRNNDREVLQTGRSTEFEEAVRYEGSEHISIVVKFPLRDVQGAMYAVCGIVTDITERKKVEEELRDSKARFQRLIDGAPLGMVVLDRDKRYVRVNHAFCDLVGYSEEEVLGQTYALFTHPEDLRANLKLTNSLFEGACTDYRLEKRYIRKGGQTIWVRVNATSLALPGSREHHVIAIIENITERKWAEEALRRSEEQLRCALDERQRFSQDLHDNIVQVLVACGLGLEGSRRLIKTEPHKAVREITCAITELNLVIEDIRHYIVGIDPVLRFSAVQFRAELRRITRALTGAKSPRFRIRLTPSVVKQLTPDQAKHLLFIAREAVSNSVRHARAGTITVSLQRHKGGTRLAVKDDGAGFSLRVTKKPGYGLRNMALRAERLKGRFQLFSARRQGTQIFVDLPAQPSEKGAFHDANPSHAGGRS